MSVLQDTSPLGEAPPLRGGTQSTVMLKCIKEKSKLRVKIISSGYLHEANCQFPRAIRRDGRYYKVPVENITLITRTNKYYYSIKKDNIEIIDEVKTINKELLESLQIYEDETSPECCICFDEEKSIVFMPCGHYYCCKECSDKVKKCPICRERVSGKIDKSQFG